MRNKIGNLDYSERFIFKFQTILRYMFHFSIRNIFLLLRVFSNVCQPQKQNKSYSIKRQNGSKTDSSLRSSISESSKFNTALDSRIAVSFRHSTTLSRKLFNRLTNKSQSSSSNKFLPLRARVPRAILCPRVLSAR